MFDIRLQRFLLIYFPRYARIKGNDREAGVSKDLKC